MKKTLLSFLALALSLSLFVACNDEEPDGDTFTPGDPYLSSYGDNVVDYDALS